MTADSIPYRQALPASSILNALLDSYDSMSSFFAFHPGDESSWRHMIASVDGREDGLPRQTVSDILVRQNQSFGADEHTVESARAIAGPGTYTIMTGQQVGLFTGPLFTVYKALTAVKLARRVENLTGARVVPVFWMASDDHDFEEINHVFVSRDDNEIERLTLAPDSPVERTSAAHVAFGTRVSALIDTFAESLTESEFKGEVVGMLRDCCTPETSFSDGFARLLTSLLRGTGIVLIDPTDSALKPLMSSVFVDELRHPLVTTRSVIDGGGKLERAGYGAQVNRSSDALNLFLNHGHQRAALLYSEGSLHAPNAGRDLSVDEAVDLAQNAPDSFSHNVITRPIVQDTLFPALAYVGGPSEIAYYAQLGDVYRHFDLQFPVIYPRSSLTLLEGRINRILAKHELKVQDFLGNIHHVMGKRMQEKIPDDLTKTFQETKRCLTSYYGRLSDQVADVDVTLKKAADGAQRKAEFELNKLQDKTLQAIKRSHKTMRQQIERSELSIYPRNQMQERIYTIWPFICSHGFELIDHLLDSINVDDFSHRIVSI